MLFVEIPVEKIPDIVWADTFNRSWEIFKKSRRVAIYMRGVKGIVGGLFPPVLCPSHQLYEVKRLTICRPL